MSNNKKGANKKDSRFTASNDARFKSFPKRKAVLQADDDRFAALLTDPNFSTGESKLDEKGRRVNKKVTKREMLKNTYQLKNKQVEQMLSNETNQKQKTKKQSKKNTKHVKAKQVAEDDDDEDSDDDIEDKQKSSDDEQESSDDDDDENDSESASSSSSSSSSSSLGSSYDWSEDELEASAEVTILLTK
jgi:hypothetical protein